MGRINLGRVILGGLLAGLVLNVVDYVLYGVVLAPDFEAALRDLGREPISSSAILCFIILDFFYGIFLVYLYAAIRPRFGPGPKTAVCAGLLLWVSSVLFHAVGEAQMGLFPSRLYVIGTVVALILLPLAAIVGAWVYKEGNTSAAPGFGG